MPELVDPIEEKACQLRASGKTQREAYDQAFKVPEGSKANNSSRFFRRDDVKRRVREIKNRRAVLADLDDAWVLRQLKAIAKNGVLIGDSNLDDYFTHTDDGRRIGIELTDVPRAKMAALEEVTVEQYTDCPRDDPQTIKKTKIKLRSAGAVLQANEMLGKWLGMWQSKVEVSGPGGGPIPLDTEFSDSDRAKALAALMAKIRAKREAA